MRILLAWRRRGKEIERILCAFKKEGHEVVYWVGYKDDVESVLDVFPQTACHFTKPDARKGRPSQDVDISRFTLPSSDLIKQMRHTESMLLTMMDRDYGDKNVDQRKHIYYHMLSYWSGVFDRYKPDVVIFNILPHTDYEYLIYEIARVRNIATRMFLHTWRPGYTILKKTIEKNEVFDSAISALGDKTFSINDISPELATYYRSQIEPNRDATSLRVSRQRERILYEQSLGWKMQILRESFRSKRLLSDLKQHLRKRKAESYRREIQRSYRKNQLKFDPAKPYVYLTLHRQPERATSPQGGVYADQILVAQTIAASLPSGWELYVKEHPVQWDLHRSHDVVALPNVRYPSYYERIARIPNVRLLPVRTDSFEIIENAQAVATIAGTVGVEAILRKKPLLVFGSAWYRVFPEAFGISDVRSCRDALSKIQRGFKPTDAALFRFLKVIDNVSLSIPAEHCREIDDSMSSEQADLLSGCLLAELREIEINKTEKDRGVKDHL